MKQRIRLTESQLNRVIRRCINESLNEKDFTDKFDRVYDFFDGYAAVRLGEKMNFIDTNGNILSDQWFDDVRSFENDYAMVKLGDKWNFIDTDGNILRNDQWFDWVGDFFDGYAMVELGGKFKYMDTDGNFCGEIPANQVLDLIIDHVLMR